MPAERRYGLDHDHYDWSALPTRPKLVWPDGAQLALCVTVVLEHLEWEQPAEGYRVKRLPGGLGGLPHPDYVRHSHWDYGHRVGIFRVLDALDQAGIRPTVAIDALTAEHYPWLAQHCVERGAELIGHGISPNRMITSKMDEATEREYIRTSLDAVASVGGSAPVGWFGPEYGESTRTPQLLAEAGVRYVCDWPNDEQPYPMHAPAGEITSLPVLYDLDDAYAMGVRQVPVDRYARMITDTAEVLVADGATTGRLFNLVLHPWLSGQPFRIGFIGQALGEITARDEVWAASGAQIVDNYRAQLD